MKVARIYQRVSTMQQNLERQEALVEKVKAEGYYVAGVYREKASGVRADCPALNRLIADLQPGDVVIAEHIDRISRLPLPEAEKLIDRIREKGAVLSIPGIVDLSEVGGCTGAAKILLDGMQQVLVRLALQSARDDYEQLRERQKAGIAEARKKGVYKGRLPDLDKHRLIVSLRQNHTINETAKLAGCSTALVKRVMRMHRETTGNPVPQTEKE